MFEKLDQIITNVKSTIQNCNLSGFTIYRDELVTMDATAYPAIAIYLLTDKQETDPNSVGNHQRVATIRVAIYMQGSPIISQIGPVADTIGKAMLANRTLNGIINCIDNFVLSSDVSKDGSIYIEGNLDFACHYMAKGF